MSVCSSSCPLAQSSRGPGLTTVSPPSFLQGALHCPISHFIPITTYSLLFLNFSGIPTSFPNYGASVRQGNSWGPGMEAPSNGLFEKSWVKGLFTEHVGNRGEAQALGTLMPACAFAALGLRGERRMWWLPPESRVVTPREELGGGPSPSLLLPDLLLGLRAQGWEGGGEGSFPSQTHRSKRSRLGRSLQSGQVRAPGHTGPASQHCTCISASVRGSLVFSRCPLSLSEAQCVCVSLSSHRSRRFCNKNALWYFSSTSRMAPEWSAAGTRAVSALRGCLESVHA